MSASLMTCAVFMPSGPKTRSRKPARRNGGPSPCRRCSRAGRSQDYCSSSDCPCEIRLQGEGEFGELVLGVILPQIDVAAGLEVGHPGGMRQQVADRYGMPPLPHLGPELGIELSSESLPSSTNVMIAAAVNCLLMHGLEDGMGRHRDAGLEICPALTFDQRPPRPCG